LFDVRHFPLLHFGICLVAVCFWAFLSKHVF
jgi:cbb3-type cytochrome oxidase subunit 3